MMEMNNEGTTLLDSLLREPMGHSILCGLINHQNDLFISCIFQAEGISESRLQSLETSTEGRRVINALIPYIPDAIMLVPMSLEAPVVPDYEPITLSRPAWTGHKPHGFFAAESQDDHNEVPHGIIKNGPN